MGEPRGRPSRGSPFACFGQSRSDEVQVDEILLPALTVVAMVLIQAVEGNDAYAVSLFWGCSFELPRGLDLTFLIVLA